MDLYDLKNLFKGNTFFKSLKNPSCIDPFLTNYSSSFQTTMIVSTGVSYCHKMIVRTLKTTLKKAKHKKIIYRSYKQFDSSVFIEHLKRKLENCEDYIQFENNILDDLNEHAPLITRLVRANEVPYMVKSLRKAIANRSRMENQFHRYYRKQKNYCSR